MSPLIRGDAPGSESAVDSAPHNFPLPPDGRARFAAISPLVYRLLELLATGGHSGRASLQVLAAEAGVPADDAFLAQGQAMLQRMHEEGTVLGTRL